MSDPFLGQIMCIAFDFAPKGWLDCAGQLLPINQNTALFSLLGTTYGGDGITTFQLPDLRGRAAIGSSAAGFPLGQKGGEELHTLLVAEMPTHTHAWMVTTAAGSLTTGASNILANASMYASGGANGTLSSSELPNAGGGQAHENRQPSIALRWIIATTGIFPTRN